MIQGGLSGFALDFVDFDLTTSTTCPILLGQLQIWQNWRSIYIQTTWWPGAIKSKSTKGSARPDGSPCIFMCMIGVVMVSLTDKFAPCTKMSIINRSNKSSLQSIAVADPACLFACQVLLCVREEYSWTYLSHMARNGAREGSIFMDQDLVKMKMLEFLDTFHHHDFSVYKANSRADAFFLSCNIFMRMFSEALSDVMTNGLFLFSPFWKAVKLVPSRTLPLPYIDFHMFISKFYSMIEWVWGCANRLKFFCKMLILKSGKNLILNKLRYFPV